MKFTPTWMLRCEWDEIVKNRFSSSAPFPKSPTSIKSAGNSFAHHHQVSGYAKDKYRKPNIWHQISETKYPKPNMQKQISKTISKIANPHKKHWEFFSLSPGHQASGYLRQNQISKTQQLTPKYFKHKYWSQIFQALISQAKILMPKCPNIHHPDLEQHEKHKDNFSSYSH